MIITEKDIPKEQHYSKVRMAFRRFYPAGEGEYQDFLNKLALTGKEEHAMYLIRHFGSENTVLKLNEDSIIKHLFFAGTVRSNADVIVKGHLVTGGDVITKGMLVVLGTITVQGRINAEKDIISNGNIAVRMGIKTKGAINHGKDKGCYIGEGLSKEEQYNVVVTAALVNFNPI